MTIIKAVTTPPERIPEKHISHKNSWIHIRNRYTIDTVLMQQPEYLDTHEGIDHLPCCKANMEINANK